jgi:hypothetical protein
MAKRSQLVVGAEWAYGRSRTHYIGGQYYEKVIIEAVEPHEQGKWNGRINKTSSGLGVLVKFGHRWGNQTETTWTSKVVQLSQLFIPWAEYEVRRAEYEVQSKINKEKAAIAKAEREKYQEEVYQPALKQFIQTIKPFAGGTYVSGWTKIEELPVEVLVAVTEALKEKAVA